MSILEKIKHLLYVAYYRGLYYFPFGIRRINRLCKIKIPTDKAVVCRLELSQNIEQFHNFIYAKISFKSWFVTKWLFWLRKFAFQIPGYDFWFKAPRFTPWDYNPETGEVRFGVNHTLLKILGEYGVEVKDIKFISWV